MRARRAVFTVACTGVALAGAHLAQAQEATSANLPDQFQTAEMMQVQKSKKKKARSNSQSLSAPKQNTALAPEQPAAAEEMVPLIVPSEKKNEATSVAAAMPSSQAPLRPIGQALPAEESPPAIAPLVRKPRPKKRPPPHVESKVANVSAPVPMSLSVAQSMAISAPLPEYSYEAKRRNLTGSGVCVVTVDVATGRVTDAKMYQSTGNTILDKLTIQTFKSWRFKPGTVPQVRLPISYE